MTNEEKAREICQPLMEDGKGYYAIAEIVAITMAEWKDQQFKEYLEETIKRLDGYVNDCIREGNCTAAALYIARTDTIRMIIDELFKED